MVGIDLGTRLLKVVWLAPVCGPWSIMQKINDPKTVAEKRARCLPMIDVVASIARFQQNQGLFFIMQNPQASKIWTLKSIMEVMKHAQVTWDDLDFCAFGLRDTDAKLRSLKPTTEGAPITLVRISTDVSLMKFCQEMAHIPLRFLKVKPLDHMLFFLVM